MRVGGQATEVDGEEELDGWDAILQHNNDPVMELNMINIWASDDDDDDQSYRYMTELSFLGIKTSQIGVNMFLSIKNMKEKKV